MGALRVAVCGLTILLVWMAAATTHACKPIWIPEPFTLPFVDTAGLTLGEHSVELECSASRRTTTCRLRARYELVNAGSESWLGHAAVFWTKASSLEVTLAGQPGAIAPTELQARAASQMYGTPSTASEIVGAGAELRIEPGGSAVIEVEGRIVPTVFIPPCQMLQIQRRHILVNRDHGTEHMIEIVHDPKLPSSTTGAIRLRVPGWWGGPRPRRRGWSTTSIARDSTRTRFSFERRPPIWPGGPIVAVGVDVRDRPQLKLRAGYEVAAPKFLIWSLAVETDAKSHVEIVPTVEITFPVMSAYLIAFPDPSIGIGAPVQVYPFARPGVRTHAGLHWHVAGIIGFFDAYPAMRGRSRELVGGVALQLGI